MAAPVPTGIKLYLEAAQLEVRYANGRQFLLPAEFLRVYSPSAEVRGHGLSEPMLVPGKRDVKIEHVVPVGRYAVRLVFSDGHDTGLFSWDALWELGTAQEALWATYESRLAEHGMSRDKAVTKLSALAQPRLYTPAKQHSAK